MSTDPHFYPPVQNNNDVPKQKQRFSARTILIPLLSLILFIAFQTIGVFVVTVFIAISQTMTGGPIDPGELFSLVNSQQTYILLIASPLTILVFSIFLRILNRREPGYLLKRPVSFGEQLNGIFIAVGAIGATTLILIAIQFLSESFAFWSGHWSNYLQLTESLTDSSNVLLQILAFVILVPIAEELIFRGVVVGELKRVFPDWVTILVSGVFFAIIHMNVVQSSYVLLAGIVLGAIYVWSGSLWMVILIHAVFNFLGSSLGLLIGDNEQASIWILNIQLLFVPVAIGLCVWFYLRYRQRKTAVNA